MTSEKQKASFHKYYINNKNRWKKYRKALKTPEQKLALKKNKQEWKKNHPLPDNRAREIFKRFLRK